MAKHRRDDRERASRAEATHRREGDERDAPSPEGVLLGVLVIVGWFAAIRISGTAAILIVVLTFFLLAAWSAIERKRQPRAALRKRARRVALIRAGRAPDYLSPLRRMLRRAAQAVLFLWAATIGTVFYGTMLAWPAYVGYTMLAGWGIPAGLAIGALAVTLWIRIGPDGAGVAAGASSGN